MKLIHQDPTVGDDFTNTSATIGVDPLQPRNETSDNWDSGRLIKLIDRCLPLKKDSKTLIRIEEPVIQLQLAETVRE
jgi:hypothetical protein